MTEQCRKQKFEMRLRQVARRSFLMGFVIALILVGIIFAAVKIFIPDDSVQTTVFEAQEYTFSPAVAHAEKTTKTYPKAEGFLLLVNWDHPIPYDRPEDLVTLGELFGDEVVLTNAEGSINKEAGEAAKRMFSDASAEGIGRYKVTSAYRSIIYQDKLWNARKKEDPSYGEDPYNNPVKVMPGNKSEHVTGLALDILSEANEQANDDYGDTPEGKWLMDNAYKYGFILRYPKHKEHITGVIYEPWHYRYVGEEAAIEMHKSGECLEEYLGKT